LESDHIKLMKQTYLLKAIILFSLVITSSRVFSQSATGIGFGYGASRPFSNDYNFGSGFQLFGNLAIADKWEIVPNLGYESIDSKGRVYVVDPYYTKRISNIDLFYIGGSAKYNFNRQFFAKLGPTFYVAGGNEDIAAIGIGGTAAGGYNWDMDEHSTFELSVYTTVINIDSGGNGITPVAGFKVAYVFNFAHGKLKPPPGRPGLF
jgi:hypothetical protein